MWSALEFRWWKLKNAAKGKLNECRSRARSRDVILRYQNQVHRGVTDGSYGEHRRGENKVKNPIPDARQAGIRHLQSMTVESNLRTVSEARSLGYWKAQSRTRVPGY